MADQFRDTSEARSEFHDPEGDKSGSLLDTINCYNKKTIVRIINMIMFNMAPRGNQKCYRAASARWVT